MRGGVVVEFSRGKELYPFGWVVGTEDVSVGFELLISLFRLSVGLGMVGGGQSYIKFEETC